jgi:hypothetical protein
MRHCRQYESFTGHLPSFHLPKNARRGSQPATPARVGTEGGMKERKPSDLLRQGLNPQYLAMEGWSRSLKCSGDPKLLL